MNFVIAKIDALEQCAGKARSIALFIRPFLPGNEKSRLCHLEN